MQVMNESLRIAWDLARRDLKAKYRRSMLGLLWLFFTPIGLLGIYYVVFGRIFKISWHGEGAGGESVGFALPFFVGLVAYLFLSDVVNSSSSLFASKRTYVVKSPFPIWILWVANLMRSGVQAIVYLGLVFALAVLQSRISLVGLGWCIPILLGSALVIAGMSLLLAALGPFIGDISEAVRLLLRVLFYATPISYPVSMVPEGLQEWLWLNPLFGLVEPLRQAVVFGKAPPLEFAVFVAGGCVLTAVAIWVFARVKGVIADVV